MTKKLFTISILLAPLSCCAQLAEGESELLGHAWVLPIGDPPKRYYGEKTKDGISIQTDPPAAEKVPSRVIVASNDTPKKIASQLKSLKAHYTLRLSRGSVSRALLYRKTASNKLKLGYTLKVGEKGSGYTWDVTVPADQTNSLLIATPLKLGSRPWAKPYFKVVNVAPSVFPVESVMFINLSGANVLAVVGENKVMIRSNSSHISSPLKKRSATAVYAKKEKKKAYLLRQYVTLKENQRKVIVVYNSLRSGAMLKVDAVDVILPLKPNTEWIDRRIEALEKVKNRAQ